MKFKKYVALLIVLVLMASLLSTTAVAVESNEVRAINTLPRKPQVASLVECTEDTEVYRIPVHSQTRGLYYLDLELTGDKTAHTVTAKLKNSLSAKPSSQWVPWNPTIKKEYAKYLGEDLSGYDVHHIVPRRYGGTNNYSNLIPLKKADHTTVTNWWKYY